MIAQKSQYQCRECQLVLKKWVGQCPDCSSWNTIEEIKSVNRARSGFFRANVSNAQAISLPEIAVDNLTRLDTKLLELNRVLGGGLVPGSVVLLGGDPGIGKTTLLMQSIGMLSSEDGYASLYVSGEESPSQLKVRAERLNLLHKNFMVLAETNLENIFSEISRINPAVVVLDSIQTVTTETSQSTAGSVAQVKECAAHFVRLAKEKNIPVFLVGHVTKEGSIAGPRILEHMVDVTLYFEGHQEGRYRIIRAIKNRFGAVNELGVFHMSDSGLKEVSNPSSILLSRHTQPVTGSVVAATLEGSRPFLVEVQALVDAQPTSSPRRLTVGLEQNRLAMLLAVLNKHGRISSGNFDIFANIVGGMRVTETGADVPFLFAILSSLTDKCFPKDTVCFGEIGLAGEIRPVKGGTERITEAAKQGFRRAIVPKANMPRQRVPNISVDSIEKIGDLLKVFN